MTQPVCMQGIEVVRNAHTQTVSLANVPERLLIAIFEAAQDARKRALPVINPASPSSASDVARACEQQMDDHNRTDLALFLEWSVREAITPQGIDPGEMVAQERTIRSLLPQPAWTTRSTRTAP